MRKTTAFTLIELLIVVAIIAVLAAIAVPNFLEAQTRARVSRVKSDLRTFGVAFESYKIDHNQIPMVNGVARASGFSAEFVDIRNNPNKRKRYPGHLLTSPVAYYEETPVDFFNTRAAKSTSWTQWGKPVGVSWVMSYSPMGRGEYDNRDNWVWKVRDTTGERMADFFTCTEWYAMLESTGPDLYWWNFLNNQSQGDPNPFFYDPTNGTVSWGQIIWLDCGGMQAPR